MSSSNPTVGTKRKSRFEDADRPSSFNGNNTGGEEPPSKRPAIDLSSAAARAAEISRDLAAKIAATTSMLGVPASTAAPLNAPPVAPHVAVAISQAQLRAQLAAQEKKLQQQIRPLLLDAQGREIDEKGNLIVATKPVLHSTTLASASVSAAAAAPAAPPKKKENPYLAHRQAPVDTTAAVVASDAVVLVQDGSTAATASASVDSAFLEPVIVDERITLRDRHRAQRGRKALQFVEPGKFIAAEEAWKVKEERKMISGYGSGRKQMNRRQLQPRTKEAKKKDFVGEGGGEDASESESGDEEEEEDEDTETNMPEYMREVPPMIPMSTAAADELVPRLDWWDVCFLPKAMQQEWNQRRRRSAVSSSMSTLLFPSSSSSFHHHHHHHLHANGRSNAADNEDADNNDNDDEPSSEQLFGQLALQHCRTYKYVQHPPSVVATGHASSSTNKAAALVVPTYLTKAERKKLRKATRAERERTKREQQMLGLAPVAEPKFKLSNFMKILGDTAVADPSKVEKKVVEQIQRRMLNHAMRNLAAKLTPHERKQKALAQLQKDCQQGLVSAVFRVTDFTCTKYQYKVDVHAQQWLLSGVALLIQDEDDDDNRYGSNQGGEDQDDDEDDKEGGGGGRKKRLVAKERSNMVLVEGGAKSMRKFIKLMTQRIRWQEFIPAKEPVPAVDSTNDPLHPHLPTTEEGDVEDGGVYYPPGYLEALRAKEAESSVNQASTTTTMNAASSSTSLQAGAQANHGNGRNDTATAEEEEEEPTTMTTTAMDEDDKKEDQARAEEEDEEDEDEDDEDEDDEDEEGGENAGGGGLTSAGMSLTGPHAVSHHQHHGPGFFGLAPIEHRAFAKCELLWQGIIAKRSFNGFKFHPVSSPSEAKQFCDSRQIGHFWDMLRQAELKDQNHRRTNKDKTATTTSSDANANQGEAESVGDIFDADFFD